MASLIFSTAMITSCVGNIIISKATSKAGNSFYNFLFKKKNSLITIPIDEYIKQTDIKEKIVISKVFVERISNSNCKFQHIITSMEDMIIEIEALLQLIENKKKRHTQKYFSSYRKLNVNKEQKQLVIYDGILSTRLDYLIKLSSVC
tara:strand:- start:311 stop:751 length:441 start_codon:yes stop_codon:yes gene_type:complete